MMPNNKPINGQALKEFQELNNLSVIDMCFYFGLSSPNAYNELVKNDEPIPATLALIYHLYNDLGENLHQDIDVTETFEKMNGYANSELSFRDFSVMLGKAHTAYSSWVRKGVVPNKSAARLLFILDRYLEKKGKKGFSRYMDIVESEAKNRGSEDILSEQSWVK
jgi:hypothetical protein